MGRRGSLWSDRAACPARARAMQVKRPRQAPWLIECAWDCPESMERWRAIARRSLRSGSGRGCFRRSDGGRESGNKPRGMALRCQVRTRQRRRLRSQRRHAANAVLLRLLLLALFGMAGISLIHGDLRHPLVAIRRRCLLGDLRQGAMPGHCHCRCGEAANQQEQDYPAKHPWAISHICRIYHFSPRPACEPWLRGSYGAPDRRSG